MNTSYKSGKKFPDPGDKYKLNSIFFKCVTKESPDADRTHGQLIVGYFRACAVHRPPPANFSIEDIDPSLCTHLVYAYAGIDDKTFTIKSNDPTEDLEGNNGKAGYKRFIDLKKKNSNVKILISVGGSNENGEFFSRISGNLELRKIFIDSVILFLSLHKFDGLDLAWEYPAFGPRGGKPEDKENFVTLVKELKEAFLPLEYVLTVAISSDKKKIDAGYDLASINANVDLVFVTSYGYHGARSDKVVDANAPLNSRDGDPFCVENTIQHLLANGIDAKKLVLGVSFYGTTYVLQDASLENIEFGRTAIESGFPGPVLNETDTISYIEIRNEFANEPSKWTRLWDDKSETPYLRHGNRIISYDNPKSVSIKVKTAKRFGLAGIMAWSIDTDDFKGLIKGEYPNYNLLRIINLDLGRVPNKETAGKTSNQTKKPPIMKSFINHGHIRPASEKNEPSFATPTLKVKSPGPSSNNEPNPKLQWSSNSKTAKLDATRKPPVIGKEQNLKKSGLKLSSVGVQGQHSAFR